MTTKSIEIQNRLPAAMKRTFFVFLFVVMLGIFETGCSVHMWREGWAIRSTTLDAYKMADYRPLVASKNKTGDIVFKYDVHLTRYGATGTLNDNQQMVGLKRITNIVSHAALKPITNIWLLLNADGFLPMKGIYPSADGTNALVQSGQNLPILNVKMESDDFCRFPTSECIVWVKEYIWYVPPLHTNDVPMAAILSKDTTHTAAYLYPAKIVLFPIFLLGDIFYVPIMYFCDH